MVEVMQEDRDTGGRPSIQISSLRCLFGNTGKGYKYCHCIPSFVSHLSMAERKNDKGSDAPSALRERTPTHHKTKHKLVKEREDEDEKE